MLGGQFKDVYAEKNKIVNKELLEEIEIKKNGKTNNGFRIDSDFFRRKKLF